MNEGRPYLQMWIGVWVPFCKIAIVSFLSVRYKSDDLYCRMAGTPSSPTLFFIRKLARCPCVARNIKMHLYEKFILWEKRMNEGMPYLKMRRGVWVSFCKIAIVSFLSVGYKSDGLYCRMAGTPSSPTLFL